MRAGCACRSPTLSTVRTCGTGQLGAQGASSVPCVPHSVAHQVEQELLESGALDGIISLSPTGEPDLDPELGSALDRKEWVHICGDISDMAGAKRAGGTLILP